jgi:hypothetical protein
MITATPETFRGRQSRLSATAGAQTASKATKGTAEKGLPTEALWAERAGTSADSAVKVRALGINNNPNSITVKTNEK